MAGRRSEIPDATIVNVKLPGAMIERIEAVGKELATQGLVLTRSGIIRYLLEQALQTRESIGKAGEAKR